MCRREWTDGIPPLPLLTPPRSFPPFLLCFAACFSVFYSPRPASLRPLLSAVFSLFPSFSFPSRSPVRPIPRSLSISLSPDPWRFSHEPGRGAASRAREMPVIRRDFDYAHYESFSPYETRGSCASTDARSSALRDKGRPASRRSAPWVRLVYTHTHINHAHTNRLLPLLPTCITLILLLILLVPLLSLLYFFFSSLFCFSSPYCYYHYRVWYCYTSISILTISFFLKSFFFYCLCLFIFLLFFYYSLWLEYCVQMRFRERLDIKYLWIYVAYCYDKSFFRKSIDETQSRLKIRMN